MISFDFWLAMILVFIGAIILFFTSIKFFRGSELRDKVVALGLSCLSIALLLNGIFYLFYLFTSVYWIFVELFHIIGAILITLGIVGFDKSKVTRKEKVKSI